MVSNFVSSPHVMSNVAEVKTTMPMTTSGVSSWPTTYSSYPYNYMYGSSSPMYYTIPKNTVFGVDSEKKMMMDVQPVSSHVMTSPVATTYTSSGVPQYSSVVATGSPSTWSYASGHPTWSNVNWNPNWNTVNTWNPTVNSVVSV